MMRLRDTSDRLTIQVVQKYASGKAPFLGIPIFDIAEGRTVTAVFRRQHLQVAAEAAARHAARITYDCEAHTLNFNSVKACCYRLVNLNASTSFPKYQFREENARWAAGRRKSAVSRALSPKAKQAARLQLEIGKLERKLDKVYARAPFHPLLEREKFEACESVREQAARWHAEKPIRRKLGQLVRRERKAWAAFYADVAAIVGREIDSAYRHDKVCNRKGGPSRVDYLKHLYRHISLSTMPWEQKHKWEPYEPLGYGAQHDQNAFQRHRAAQLEYLNAMSERAAIQAQIDAHRVTVAELTATVTP